MRTQRLPGRVDRLAVLIVSLALLDVVLGVVVIGVVVAPR
jgi:hypothetical protein